MFNTNILQPWVAADRYRSSLCNYLTSLYAGYALSDMQKAVRLPWILQSPDMAINSHILPISQSLLSYFYKRSS